jgi:hypothetical protein
MKITLLSRVYNSKANLIVYKAPIPKNHYIDIGLQNQIQAIQFVINKKQRVLDCFSLSLIEKGFLNPLRNLKPTKTFAV